MCLEISQVILALFDDELNDIECLSFDLEGIIGF